MDVREDSFEALVAEDNADDFTTLTNKPRTSPRSEIPAFPTNAYIARFHGFDTEVQPLVTGMAQLPGETVLARTTIPLSYETIGADVVVLCEQGDPRRPIIIGVISPRSLPSVSSAIPRELMSVEADEDRYVISAKREIVLRCGDSSITLTCTGKVIIKGNYILSRSTGYNKIKGAAVDIN